MSKLNQYKKSEISQKKEAAEPHEIIHELLSQLNKNLSDAIKNIDKGKIDCAKEKDLRRSFFISISRDLIKVTSLYAEQLQCKFLPQILNLV